MTCSRIDCENEATHYPVLKIWAIGQDTQKPPGQAILPLPICTPCTQKLTIADVVDDNGYLQIVNMMALHGMKAPDRKTMELSWIERPEENKIGVEYVTPD